MGPHPANQCPAGGPAGPYIPSRQPAWADSVRPAYLMPPGCVPAMKASVIAPGVSWVDDAPDLSTDTKTMLPGGSNFGDSLRSPIQAFITSIQIGSAPSAPVTLWPIGFF